MTSPTVTIDLDSEPGAYAKAMLYPPFCRITDDTFTNGFVPKVRADSPQGEGDEASVSHGAEIAHD